MPAQPKCFSHSPPLPTSHLPGGFCPQQAEEPWKGSRQHVYMQAGCGFRHPSTQVPAPNGSQRGLSNARSAPGALPRRGARSFEELRPAKTSCKVMGRGCPAILEAANLAQRVLIPSDDAHLIAVCSSSAGTGLSAPGGKQWGQCWRGHGACTTLHRGRVALQISLLVPRLLDNDLIMLQQARACKVSASFPGSPPARCGAGGEKAGVVSAGMKSRALTAGCVASFFFLTTRWKNPL